jgi:uncharacterized protein
MNLIWIAKTRAQFVLISIFLAFSISGFCQPSNRSAQTIELIKSIAELPAMEKIINKEYDVNVRGAEGATPLMLAAILDDSENIKKLLKLSANLNLRDIRGNTALFHAMQSHSLNAAALLIDAGALDNTESVDKINLQKMLQFASQSGDLKSVQYLLIKPIDVNYKDTTGKTPFHSACNSGNVEVVKTLLKAGGNVSLADNSGMAPFHWAAPKASEEMVQVLLNSGADIYAITKSGTSALQLAAYRAETLRLFLKYVKSPKTIIDEQFLLDDVIDNKNAIELVSILLEFGGNPDNRRRGRLLGTHLHSAISLGEFEMTKLLIKAGASMTTKDFNGMTAVDLINKTGKEDFKKLLDK